VGRSNLDPEPALVEEEQIMIVTVEEAEFAGEAEAEPAVGETADDVYATVEG
jgi:hypothetical protein